MAKSSNSPKPSAGQSPKGKGKAAAAASPASVPLPTSSPTKAQTERLALDDNDLLALAEAITARAHLLVPGQTDDGLVQVAQEALKASFDRALSSESISFPHLSTLLDDLSPAAGPSTRSQTRAANEPKAAPPAPKTLSLTPLEELTTEGMDPEMIWEQMEMRASVVTDLLEDMFGTEGQDSDEEDGDEDDDEDEDEDEEMEGLGYGDDSEEESEEEEEDDDDDDEGSDDDAIDAEPYFDKLGPAGVGMDAQESESEEEEDPQADATKDLTLDSFDKPGSGASAKRQRRAPGPASSVDDAFFSLHDFHVATDEGEFEMEKALRGEVDDDDEFAGEEDDFDLFAAVDDEDEDENLDNAEPMYSDFFDPPPRPVDANGKPKKKGKGKPRHHPEDDLAAAEPAPAAEKAEKPTENGKRKRRVTFSEAVKVKTIPKRGSDFDKLVAKVGWERAEEMTNALEAQKAKARAAEGQDEEEDDDDESEEGEEDLNGPEPGDDSDEEEDEVEDDEDGMEVDEDEEEEEEDDEEEEGSGEEESDDDEGQETIERLKTSLFDDEDEEDLSPQAKLTRHERRLVQLSSQIAALEAENVGPKDWATKGEAQARDRPTNSLLDEDLEYERMGKVVPVVTEETTKTIEDLIKRRILDNNFDDVVRQRPVDPNAFLPSRFMELQDTKSNKSLAEIYEDDYQQAKEKEAGRKVVHELDAELEKKHQEIEDLYDELASKLDALSNARFTPKPPKATIESISNVASISLESALPTTKSTSTLLAPEEVYTIDPTNEDRSDFTPSQKKQARQKRRKARASMAKAAEKFSKGEKGEKERATKQLIGTKGVTVIGKGGKVETGGKKRKRGEGEDTHSGVGLKL